MDPPIRHHAHTGAITPSSAEDEEELDNVLKVIERSRPHPAFSKQRHVRPEIAQPRPLRVPTVPPPAASVAGSSKTASTATTRAVLPHTHNHGRGPKSPGARSRLSETPSLNPSKYTFLREGTPPPPPTADETLSDHEKFAPGGGSMMTSSTRIRGHSDVPLRYDPYDDEASRRTNTMVCGIRRKIFWAIIAALAVIVVGLGIGLGVGLGVSMSNAQPNGGSSSPAKTTSSGTPTASPTSSAPTSTSTAVIVNDCPSSNGTIYQVPRSDKKFLRLCGIEYSGPGEAVDIRYVLTSNMSDCMNNCAGTTGCTGCSWGHIDGDPPEEHRCWMKNNLARSHTAPRADWSFALLLEGPR